MTRRSEPQMLLARTRRRTWPAMLHFASAAVLLVDMRCFGGQQAYCKRPRDTECSYVALVVAGQVDACIVAGTAIFFRSVVVSATTTRRLKPGLLPTNADQPCTVSGVLICWHTARPALALQPECLPRQLTATTPETTDPTCTPKHPTLRSTSSSASSAR